MRAWSLRLRAAADAQTALGRTVLAECDGAALEGVAGDALRALAERLSADAAASAAAAVAAAEQLEGWAGLLLRGDGSGPGTPR